MLSKTTLTQRFPVICFTAIQTVPFVFFTNFAIYTRTTYAAAIYVVKTINTFYKKSVLNSIYQTSNEFLNNHFFLSQIFFNGERKFYCRILKKKVKILKFLIYIKTYLELFGCPKRCLTN